MMFVLSTIAWLLQLMPLVVQPDFCFTSDRRNYDGDRFTEYCGGLYQKTATWRCLEVPIASPTRAGRR